MPYLDDEGYNRLVENLETHLVPKTRKVNGLELSEDIDIDASEILMDKSAGTPVSVKEAIESGGGGTVMSVNNIDPGGDGNIALTAAEIPIDGTEGSATTGEAIRKNAELIQDVNDDLKELSDIVSNEWARSIHERTLLLLISTESVDAAFAALDEMKQTGIALANIIPSDNEALRACETLAEVAASDEAMPVALTNSNSADAIVASSSFVMFMNRILDNPALFELFVGNKSYMEEIAERADIVAAILNSTAAMAALVESSMALNVLKDSPTAMAVVVDYYAAMTVPQMLTSIFTGNTIALAVRVPSVVKRIYDNVTTNQINFTQAGWTRHNNTATLPAVTVNTVSTATPNSVHNQSNVRRIFTETPVGFIKLKTEPIAFAGPQHSPFRIADTTAFGPYYNNDTILDGIDIKTSNSGTGAPGSPNRQSIIFYPDPLYADSDRRSLQLSINDAYPGWISKWGHIFLVMNSKDFVAIHDGTNYFGHDAIISSKEMFFGAGAYDGTKITVSAAMYNVTGGA